MREKELRLALVCYGGVSLAVYMHGVTKEIWHLARASRDFIDAQTPADNEIGSSAKIYREIFEAAAHEDGLRLRAVPDIIAGASAGGINAVFLAHALETGQSLDPLTELWLHAADADVLLDPDARPLSRFTKFWAAPVLWSALRWHDDTVQRTVAPETREEVRRKLSNFVRGRWFAPPFSGAGFTGLLLDSFDAMAAGKLGKPLLPDGHPLDLFVTATDFGGHDERLKLNSPPEIIETEHRLTIGMHARGPRPRQLASPCELTFSARATASFPGAFPPFTVHELDAVLAERGIAWPGRSAFLARVFPEHSAAGAAQDVVLIDGSVLANAPFAQAIDALKDRPARRVVDRRFVYIEPTPNSGGFRLTAPGPADEKGRPRLPGFFRTIFGAMSDIPREQPIRDNLEVISQRSRRIRRMQHIVETLRPDIEHQVEATLGRSLFLSRPTPKRLAHWRRRLQQKAARAAGYAYPAYGLLKLSNITDELAALTQTLAGGDGEAGRETLRRAFWTAFERDGVNEVGHATADGASAALVTFFRSHDLAFRIRRLRFLARETAALSEAREETRSDADAHAHHALRDMLYDAITQYAARQKADFYDETVREKARQAVEMPLAALDAIAAATDLYSLDDALDERLATAMMALPVEERKSLLRAYLGFPFFDIATLPLLQGEGLDEYDPIKVDRISPDDAASIRSGGAAATLRGVEFNSFGAFFSRAYRENDYLWGRLHGAERLIDILLSTLPAGSAIAREDRVRDWKRRAFLAILDEEELRLTRSAALIADLRQEIDQALPPV